MASKLNRDALRLARALVTGCLAVSPLACGAAPDDDGGENADAAELEACSGSKVAGHTWHGGTSFRGDVYGEWSDVREHPLPGMFRTITLRTDGLFKARQVRSCSVDALPAGVTPCEDWQRMGSYRFAPSACNRKRIVLTFKNGEERVYRHTWEDFFGDDEYGPWLFLEDQHGVTQMFKD